MTIKPGEEWGRPVDTVESALCAANDADLARQLPGTGEPFALHDGDLYRTIGSPRPGRYTTIVAVDALAVRLDDAPERLAVAHVVARRSWWRGRIVAVCNAEYLGAWNVSPRAHPNDGRADVVDVAPAMGVRARWQAWRRLPQGAHLPHPSITTRSAREATFEFERPLQVWIDGTPAAHRVRRMTVTVLPDAFELYV